MNSNKTKMATTAEHYEPHEVGCGRIDPQRLGQSLTTTAAIQVAASPVARGERWIGASALALVLLSWWTQSSVPVVIWRAVAAAKELLN